MLDVFKANPGMEETNRAHCRWIFIQFQIEELRKKREEARDLDARLEVEATIAKYSSSLKIIELQIILCYENEDKLRAQLGMPPLDPSTVRMGTDFKRPPVWVS